MLSALFRRKEPDLRQKCREWFLSSKDRLLTYARLHADSKTDVELLLSSVTQEVVKKIISGEREFDDIEPYTLKALRNSCLSGAVDECFELQCIPQREKTHRNM